MNITRSFGGYSAVQIQPYYHMLPEETKTKVAQEMMKQIAPDAVLGKWEVKNGERNLSPLSHPFIVTAETTSSSFIENAGNKILFKAGELIGPQVEMYKDDQRETEVQNQYNRTYRRKITIQIPEGYKVKNPDDLKFDIYSENETGERVNTFTSDYELKGQELKITVLEYYKQINFPKEKFEEFRKVVNAAADFNKVNLIMESN